MFFNVSAYTSIYLLSYTTLFRSSGIVAIGRDPPFGIGHAGHHVERWLVGKSGDVAKGVDDFDAVALGIVSDRKSTRLNSSHLGISYAVFCLKKKKADTDRSSQCD